ncbi:MAG: hypothetical protein ABID38_00760 [Candidatus Diapherotrites archaeon]
MVSIEGLLKENKSLAIVAMVLLALIVLFFFFQAIGEQPKPTIKNFFIEYAPVKASKIVEIGEERTETIFLSDANRFSIVTVVPKALEEKASNIKLEHNAKISIWEEDPIMLFTPKDENIKITTIYKNNSDIGTVNLIFPSDFILALDEGQKQQIIAELNEIANMDLNDDGANMLENLLGENLVAVFSSAEQELKANSPQKTVNFSASEPIVTSVINAMKAAVKKAKAAYEEYKQPDPKKLSLELGQKYIDPYKSETLGISVTSNFAVPKEDLEIRITTEKGDVVKRLVLNEDLKVNSTQIFHWDCRNENGEIVIKNSKGNANETFVVKLYHKGEFIQLKPVAIVRQDERCPSKEELREKYQFEPYISFKLSESNQIENQSLILVQPGYDFEEVFPKDMYAEGEAAEYLLFNLSDSYVLCEGKVKERNDWSEEDKSFFDIISNADPAYLTDDRIELVFAESGIEDYGEKIDRMVADGILLKGKTRILDVMVDLTGKIDWVNPPSYLGGKVVLDYGDYLFGEDRFIETNLALTKTEILSKGKRETYNENGNVESSFEEWIRPDSRIMEEESKKKMEDQIPIWEIPPGQLAKEQNTDTFYNEDGDKTGEHKESSIYGLDGEKELVVKEDLAFANGFTPSEGESEQIWYYSLGYSDSEPYKSIIKEYEYEPAPGHEQYYYDLPKLVTTYLSLPELGIDKVRIKQKSKDYVFGSHEFSGGWSKTYNFNGEVVLKSEITEIVGPPLHNVTMHTRTYKYDGDFDSSQTRKLLEIQEITESADDTFDQRKTVTETFERAPETPEDKPETFNEPKRISKETSINKSEYSTGSRSDETSNELVNYRDYFTTSRSTENILDAQGNLEKVIMKTSFLKSKCEKNCKTWSYMEMQYGLFDGTSKQTREIAVNFDGETSSEETIFEYNQVNGKPEDVVTKRCFIGSITDTTPGGTEFKRITKITSYLDDDGFRPNLVIEEMAQAEGLEIGNGLSIDYGCPRPRTELKDPNEEKPTEEPAEQPVKKVIEEPKFLGDGDFEYNEADVKKARKKTYEYKYDGEGHIIGKKSSETTIEKKIPIERGKISLELVGKIWSTSNYAANLEYDASADYSTLPFEDKCWDITRLDTGYPKDSKSKPTEIIEKYARVSETGEIGEPFATQVIHNYFYEAQEPEDIKITETSLFLNGELAEKKTEHFDVEGVKYCTYAKFNCGMSVLVPSEVSGSSMSSECR